MHNVKSFFYFFVRSFIIKLLYKINLTILKTVNEEKIITFIKKLKIYKTNHNLIRLGDKKQDGGYLIPDDLIGISSCFTGGVGQTINFEYDLADRDIKSFLADYSVNRLPSSSSINSNFSLDNKMYFTKKFLGTDNNEMHINFNEWFLKNSKPNEDHILKLDIEGDEYKVLPMITDENLLKMRIIIFEIHNFRNILFPLGLEIIQGIFDKLLKKHTIVHICPNNISPSIKYSNKLELFDLLEITLLRNDRISYKECAKIFPHPLDSKNNPLFSNKLPDCFYL